VPINTNNTLLKNINLILDNAKAESISIVDLKNKTSIADFFV